ncbi:MAG: succinyl-CoA synthetase subunit alpha, partial [Clostridiales bacterium]|nr:succinyl-CoA synthetase subunit alpha [Clostridiales bacterium]
MVAIKILKRFYQDSLKLMRVSAEIKNSDGVVQAFAFMATETNKKSRIKNEFMDDGVRAAGADDLVLMVECENETVGKNAIDEFEKRISSSAAAKDDETENLPATFEQGKILSDANLAVISVPGIYAAVQTLNALNNGMNVMLFSDNVSVEDEIMLKDYAAGKNLLVMGPDCGTAI